MENTTYYVKILNLSGAVIAAPLDVASVEFTESLFVPGTHRLGSCALTLLNTRGAPYLRSLYNTLVARQRVEIYDSIDLLPDPVWTGVLIRKVRDLEGNWQWIGNSYEDWLDRRHVSQYYQVTGNAMTALQKFLGTYNVGFKDDFNRTTGIGANWSATEWSIVSNAVQSSGIGVPNALENASAFSAANWSDVRIEVDLKNFDGNIYLHRLAANNYIYLSLSAVSGSSDGLFQAVIYDQSAAQLQDLSRTILLDNTVYNHWTIYSTLEGTSRRWIFILNNLEIFNFLDTRTGLSHTGTVYFASATLSNVQYIDNFIFAPKTTILTAGNLATTTDTITQQFNGDSYLSIIEWICEKEGWEYRIRPKAGAGNDLIDVGASTGIAWTGALTLNDGSDGGRANIESLNLDDSHEELATELMLYGQSRDDALSSFVSTNLSAMDTYGILEGEYHDERIQDSAIAKAIGDVRLARLSAGNVAIQGRIKDESYLLRQDPKWGYAVWGDFIWGGRDKFHVGDTIPMKCDDLNIDRTVKFVSITRKSGDVEIDVLFDYHMWRRSDDERSLRRQVELLQRALTQKMDSQTLVFALSGTTAQTISFNMRGNLYKAVYLDVTSAAWAGNITFKIDGTDRTSALFGAANLSANSFASDTAYLVFSGVHTITLTPTQTVTVTVRIAPILMG